MKCGISPNANSSIRSEKSNRLRLLRELIGHGLELFFAVVLIGVAVSARGDAIVTVDWNTVSQRIDGFGASSAWNDSWTPTQANMFFSTNGGTGTSFDGKTHFSFAGVGLSLLRNHIAYATSSSSNATPTTVETTIMQLAQEHGARVWSTPWTPASGFKSNNGPNGGNYLGSGNNATNLAYASQLAKYVAHMKSLGVNLYAISVQNEPDANVTTYEACVWNGAQIHDFVTNLYAALAGNGVGSTKIIVPESQVWSGNTGLFTPTLSDPIAAATVSIIANHDYVADNATGDTTVPPALAVSGQATWETEVSQIDGGYDGSITNAIYWAGRIHLFLTAAKVNAWHYWWLIPQGPDNEGLTDTNGIPAKRMYALGQFARFVRPNYYAIGVTGGGGTAQISAYKDSVTPGFAIVAINPSQAAINQTFNLANVTGVFSVTPWMTTSDLSLASQSAVTVSNATFTYTLPAMSITTFTGQSSPPSLSIAYNGNTLIVSWPSPSPGYNTLLQSPTLSPAVWTTNSFPVTTANGTNSVGLALGPGSLFLRLRNP
jgi:glucuronoarabinoxylan endo-1,4-beta-xylanase